MELELFVPGDTRWGPHHGALNRDGRDFLSNYRVAKSGGSV